MQKKPRILVVEDETAIRTGLVDVLVFHGYEVDWAADGNDGLEKALAGRHDLILLDIMLPGIDGFTICERLRQRFPEQAVIMLTARNTEADVIQGLSLGADDYVGKPFSIAQLLLRIQAVLRRTLGNHPQQQRIDFDTDTWVDCLNLEGRRQGRKQQFTRREVEILQYLNNHAQRPVTREELLEKVWGYAPDLHLETRTVDIHIAKLRRKIEADPSSPRFLTTIRGAGYRLHPNGG